MTLGDIKPGDTVIARLEQAALAIRALGSRNSRLLDLPVIEDAAAALRAVIAERDRYRQLAGTFVALWSVTYAQRHGAPSDAHVRAEHYDLMAECGCRMDDFVRWEP